MQDKLLKFGQMLWLNKERFILVAMVVILCYQVYKVVYPDEKPRGVSPTPPVAAPGKADAPPEPIPAQTLTFSGDYRSIWQRNPFWSMSGRGGNQGNGSANEVFIKLLDLQDATGSKPAQAQLQTATTTKWYPVGDSFEQFRLDSVDLGAGTATVYIESLGQTRTLTKE